VAVVADDAVRAVFGGTPPGPRLVVDPAAGSIVTDGERLRGVLVNLLENARDSVDAAGGRRVGDVEIGARRLDPDRVLLWVEDRGQGVAASDLPHVFEPYFTTKRTGTGLGLAIARKVVEALGGSMRMESREGEGSRVEIELNAAGPPAEGLR
jgi:two-component system sensor histidine kinase HydH